MWKIQADTRNHTLTRTHTHGQLDTGQAVIGICIVFCLCEKHTRTRNVLRFLKVLFASCSLQSISREMRVGEGEREREELHTDTNNNTDNAHSLLLCPLAFFLCLRLRKSRIIYINNNPDYERFTQCDRMRPMCKIPQVLLGKIPMQLVGFFCMLSTIDH